MNIYLDESGNTGKNLIDEKQPFFNLASVLIRDKKISSLADYLTTLPSDLKDEYGEIKGNNIACYNQSLALTILTEKIPEFTEGFFFGVIEKKFMIAGKIVDNFFDPQYNKKVSNLWTYKSNFKIELANFLYDNLSEDAMSESYNAFLSKNVDDAKRALSKIINETKDIPYEFNLVDTISGIEENLTELIKNISSSNSKNALARGIPKNTICTPNVTSFVEMTNRLESFLEKMQFSSTIIFDDCVQYNTIFETLLKTFIKAPKKIIPISSTETFRVGYEYIKGYSVQNSKDSVGLQLADILASTINHVFTKILQKENNELTPEDRLLVLFIFGITYSSEFGYLTISNKTFERIGNILKTSNA